MIVEAQKRKIIPITDHLFFYEDDPIKILYTQEDGTPKWLRFCSDGFSSTHFSPVEQTILKKHRKIADMFPESNRDPEGENLLTVMKDLSALFMNRELNMALQNFSELKGSKLPLVPEREERLPERQEQKQKKEMVVRPGSELALARELRMPEELADLFFKKIEGKPYIMNPGLLYMASKKGYRAIEITDKFNTETKQWEAETKIYPQITVAEIEAIAKLAPEIQKEALDAITRPTTGLGTASKENVKNDRMHPFLREMAQTRSQNRALRPYTGYGGTSYEEMPEAEVVDGDSQ